MYTVCLTSRQKYNSNNNNNDGNLSSAHSNGCNLHFFLVCFSYFRVVNTDLVFLTLENTCGNVYIIPNLLIDLF